MAKQTFTTGQVLTAAQMTSLQQTAMGGGSATAKTASYVLVAADAGTTVAMNAAGATTITVNTGLFAAGDTVFIQNLGAGACTVTAGTATVATAGSLILPQNDAGILYFTATGASIFYDYIQAGAVSPLTTKGDLYTFSTSDARLGVGANNTVLTADSAEATGLKWATPATPSSGANFISRTSFSASATVTIDSIFSGTYENYIVDCQITGSADLSMRGRYSTTTHTAANYQYAFCGIKSDSATLIGRNAYDQTSWALGSCSSQGFFGTLFFYRSSSSGHLYFQGFTLNRNNGNSLQGSGFIESNQLWTGLNWFPASGTLTGQVSCYGLAAS
jgi:hypothetical protein